MRLERLLCLVVLCYILSLLALYTLSFGVLFPFVLWVFFFFLFELTTVFGPRALFSEW